MEKLEAKEFDRLYEEVHKKFEKIRAEVYYMIMGEEVEEMTAR